MNATAHTLSHATPLPQRSLWRILGLEARYELLKLLRLPAFVIPTFAFPVMFYLLFGVAFGQQTAGPITVAAYLVVSYSIFGVLGTNLGSLGIGLANERGQGWMILKRAMPMPVAVHFLARIAIGLVFSLAITLAIFTIGATFGKVDLPLGTWLGIGAIAIAGGIPFAALGLLLGNLCGPNAAPAVINLIYLPMSFASGLWIPLRSLPDMVKQIAPWLPPYHVAQHGHALLGAAESPPSAGVSIAYLTAFTALCLVGAWFAYRRDQRTFG